MLEKIKETPRNLADFYGGVKTELKKVTWPGKDEVYGTTVIVIITVFFFGFYLFAVDWVLSHVVDSILAFFR